MPPEVTRYIRSIAAREGVTPTTAYDRMRTVGVQVSRVSVGRWLGGKREPQLGQLALLLTILGATDHERLMVLRLAEASILRPVAA